MFRTSLILLFGVFSFGALSAADGIQAVTVNFYSERLNISYNSDMNLPFRGLISEKALTDYFRQLSNRDHQTLLFTLEQYKSALQLNDWLYYELLRQAVRQILGTQNQVQEELTSWFLLTQAGFDTRLTFRADEVFLYVFTQDEVFEVPMIEDDGRRFVNLTSIHRRSNQQQPLFLLDFAPQAKGRAFSFYLSSLPRLQPRPAQRSFNFNFGGYVYQVDVDTDQTIIDLMRRYPFIAEQQYLEVPLSHTLSGSLLPQLREMIKGKTEREALEFLVAFTRSSFQYKDDKDFFGHSKPMIADEVFHYPFSDCEDRSALFYRLVRELLDLPMIIIAYKDHLTIGVALSQPAGPAISFQKRDYYICDPTGPANSTAIGRFPKGYENAPFEIIGRYR